MPCDSRPFTQNQTLTERKQQVSEAVASLARQLAAGRVKPVVDKKTGAIAFDGWTDRAGVTDACALRRVMSTGSVAAKLAIQKAELLAGRQISRQALAQGVHGHSHAHGITWHDHKG